MIRAKLTSKGQITIPVAIRNKLNLQPGDELIFEIGRDEVVKLRSFKRKRLTELYASLPAKRPFPNKEQVREEVAAEMARRILEKEKKNR
jgi:AbrB family looped-hinge helix DNA binding protein